MGWWKSGDDLLGDGPADLADDGLAELAARYGKPGWQQFLDALDAALDVTLGSRTRLRAAFHGGHPDLHSDPACASKQLAETLTAIIEQVRAEYLEIQQREPRLSEVLGTFRFCLGPTPGKAISEPGLVPKLDKIVAEDHPNPPPSVRV